MVKIRSDSLLINKPAKVVYNFLSDFNNFEHLMPDQITNWQSTELTCSFTIQGMADISMKIHEKEMDARVHIKSHGKVPFDFDMISHLEPVDEEKVNVHIEIDADLNPMMMMMVKKPLQNLANIMVEKLKHHHEEGGE